MMARIMMVVMEAITTDQIMVIMVIMVTMMMVMVVMVLTRDDKEVYRRSTVEPKDCCSSNYHNIVTKGLKLITVNLYDFCGIGI